MTDINHAKDKEVVGDSFDKLPEEAEEGDEKNVLAPLQEPTSTEGNSFCCGSIIITSTIGLITAGYILHRYLGTPAAETAMQADLREIQDLFGGFEQRVEEMRQLTDSIQTNNPPEEPLGQVPEY